MIGIDNECDNRTSFSLEKDMIIMLYFRIFYFKGLILTYNMSDTYKCKRNGNKCGTTSDKYWKNYFSWKQAWL